MAVDKQAPAKGNYQFHWSSGDASKLYHPKRKDHFMVLIGGKTSGGCGTGFGIGADSAQVGAGQVATNTTDNGSMWYAKSISKPSLSFGKSSEDWDGVRIGDTGALLKDYGVVTLEQVKATLIDPVYPDSTRKFLKVLREAGYQGSNEIDTKAMAKAIGSVKIFQYTTTPNTGNTLVLAEEWTLKSPLFTNISFGDLDYSSDEFVELNVTFGYVSFSAKMYSLSGNEGEFEYFGEESNQASNEFLGLIPTSGKGGYGGTECDAAPAGGGGGSSASSPSAPPSGGAISPPAGAQAIIQSQTTTNPGAI